MYVIASFDNFQKYTSNTNTFHRKFVVVNPAKYKLFDGDLLRFVFLRDF